VATYGTVPASNSSTVLISKKQQKSLRSCICRKEIDRGNDVAGGRRLNRSVVFRTEFVTIRHTETNTNFFVMLQPVTVLHCCLDVLLSITSTGLVTLSVDLLNHFWVAVVRIRMMVTFSELDNFNISPSV
jgi:hypothetical protein